MELPVGDFITNALSTDVPVQLHRDPRSNVRDEEKHDMALGYIASAHGVDEKAEKEAIALRDAWIAHPDHTVLKAMVAERAIFLCCSPSYDLTVTLLCVQPQRT